MDLSVDVNNAKNKIEWDIMWNTFYINSVVLQLFNKIMDLPKSKVNNEFSDKKTIRLDPQKKKIITYFHFSCVDYKKVAKKNPIRDIGIMPHRRTLVSFGFISCSLFISVRIDINIYCHEIILRWWVNALVQRQATISTVPNELTMMLIIFRVNAVLLCFAARGMITDIFIKSIELHAKYGRTDSRFNWWCKR